MFVGFQSVFFHLEDGLRSPTFQAPKSYRVLKGPGGLLRGGGSLIFPNVPCKVPQSSQTESLGFPSYPLPLNTPPLKNPTTNPERGTFQPHHRTLPSSPLGWFVQVVGWEVHDPIWGISIFPATTLPETNIKKSTWKWMAKEYFLVSFWGVKFGLFSGTVLVSGRVEIVDSWYSWYSRLAKVFFLHFEVVSRCPPSQR